MVHKVIDRCKETTSSTGTGNLTLTGAVSGFATMASALTSNGDTSWFCAENGAEWEVFLGTRVSATELARTTVLSSSNSGSAVNFTAPPTVFSTVPGARMSHQTAVLAVLATTDQSVSSGVWTKVQLNSETLDAGGTFDSTTNYRWTPNVPGYYIVSFSVEFGAASGLQGPICAVYKNGTVIAPGCYTAPAAATSGVSTGSALVHMNGTTDYLELWGFAAGTTLKFKATYSTQLSGILVLATG